MAERLQAITSEFTAEDWLTAGVAASELRVTESGFARLDLDAAFRRCSSSGLLQQAGRVSTYAVGRGPGRELSFEMSPEFRAAILRELTERGRLSEVVSAARACVGERSLAPFTTTLYSGDLSQLERRAQALKLCFRDGNEWEFARERLREAVLTEFDGAAFERRYGAFAALVSEQLLADSVNELSDVGALYDWTRRAEFTGRSKAGLPRAIWDQALLRGDADSLKDLNPLFDTGTQLLLNGARSYVMEDWSAAQRSFEEGLAWGTHARAASGTSRNLPAGALAILGLIAVRLNEPGAQAALKAWLRPARAKSSGALPGFPAPDTQAAVIRGLKTLLKYESLSEAERPRLDAHQVPARTAAWEVLLLGLTAHVHQTAALVRLAWARRLESLAERASAWHGTWFAHQARELARALEQAHPDAESSPEPRMAAEVMTVSEMADAGMSDAGRVAQPQPLSPFLLLNLPKPRPVWRQTLDSLESWATELERRQAPNLKRIAWFLDMRSGELTKPGLEEFLSGQGWTLLRRLDVTELGALERELPEEDRAVVRALSGNEGETAALEALCGHSRVFNGVRGRARVDVVHGTCRVVTERDAERVRLRFVPPNPRPGVHVVVESESRVCVYRVSDDVAKLARLLNSGLELPARHQSELVRLLGRMVEHVELESPFLSPRSVAADSSPCLRISPAAGAFWVELGVRPFGEHGRFFPPGRGVTSVSAYTPEGHLTAERSLQEELARHEQLISNCPSLLAARQASLEEGNPDASSGTPFQFAFGEEALLELLQELTQLAPAPAVEWQNTRPVHCRGRVGLSQLKGGLRRNKGWYLVAGSVRLDAVTEVSLAELSRMPFTRSGKFLRLPSGDFVEVERRMQRVLSALSQTTTKTSQAVAPELRLGDADFPTLRLLAEAESGFELADEARQSLARFEESFRAEPALPEGLCATLRPYQVEGYHWLCRFSDLGLGVCLADDMGLGKTLQVIALLLRRAGKQRCLVVAPTSVCSNWLIEMQRFAPALRAQEYVGKNRRQLLKAYTKANDAEPEQATPPDVLITSYTLLQQDSDALSEISWDTVVLDEAQFIKNANSLRAKAAYRLQAQRRLALTGTPIENHLGDLYSLFHFLNPSLLGSFKEFQVRYLNPIERDSDTERRRELRSRMQPFILRRTKQQVLSDLPSLTVIRHEVRLDEQEQMRYALLRRQIHDKLFTSHGRRDYKLEVFAELVRLRRFCCHPRLVFPEASLESSKLRVLLDLVEELRENGHRALVFSQFVDFLDLVREVLNERGIRYEYLDGSTPKEQRQARVTAFQEGSAELFLISLKAGGFGLNLTGADYVIHLDPWWNPAVEAQATDRAHRIGQIRPVTVYRLVTKDTIEEKMVELYAEKRALADGILEDTDLAARLGFDDVARLLASDPSAADLAAGDPSLGLVSS